MENIDGPPGKRRVRAGFAGMNPDGNVALILEDADRAGFVLGIQRSLQDLSGPIGNL